MSPSYRHAKQGVKPLLLGLERQFELVTTSSKRQAVSLNGGGYVVPPLHYSIHLAQRGTFFGLKVVEAPPQYAVGDTPESLEDTCVVRVRAVGLNFRDVLNVLGEYPGDPGPPGADCAGDGVAVVSGEKIGRAHV